jgi:hypothetical protein
MRWHLPLHQHLIREKGAERERCVREGGAEAKAGRQRAEKMNAIVKDSKKW